MTQLNNIDAKLLIYGAAGYTGRLISQEAARRGLKFEIAGRYEDELVEFAKELNVAYHVFAVDDEEGWTKGLNGKTSLLNVAGPFSGTAEQAMNACIKNKVHYVDISAEVDIYRLAETKDGAAKDAGIMLMSGAGLFATYDPLVIHTAKRVKEPVSLRAAFKYSGGFTPGSVASSANILNAGILVRKNGEIKKLTELPPANFDFGNGPEECFPTPLGGVVLCYKSSGIPDIEEYFQMALPVGLSESETLKTEKEQKDVPDAGERSMIVVEVTGADGSHARSLITVPAGYMPTVNASVEIVSRSLRGSYKTGFQSPASAYGQDLIAAIPGATLTDLK